MPRRWEDFEAPDTMSGSTRTVRRVQPSRVADFDDQLWPINCAILILAGFVAGIVIATGDFDDPHLLRSGWVRLLSVGVMVGLLFWGVTWLEGKMRRRLQFCLLVSLLVHLVLAVYLHQRYLAMVADWDATSRDQATESYQQITLPDYYWRQIEQPYAQQSFEEPIQTEAPRPTDPEAVQRRAEEPAISAKTARTEEPEVPQRQQPNPAIDRRALLSAPRRAEAAAGAQISRQPWKDRPSPNQPIPEPEITPQPRQTAAVPDSLPGHPPRTESPVHVEQSRTTAQPSSGQVQQVEVKLPQQAARPEPLADARTTLTPARQASPPAHLPPPEAVAPQPGSLWIAAAQRSPSIAPTPAETAVARQQPEAPRVVRPITALAPEMPPERAADLALQAGPSEMARDTARPGQDPQAGTPAQPSSPRRTSRPARAARPEDGLLVATAQIEPPTVGAEAASSRRPPVRPTTTAVSTQAEIAAEAMRDGSAGSGLPPTRDTAELPSAVAARRTSASQSQPPGFEAVPARPSSPTRSGRGVNLPSNAIAVEIQPAASPAAAGGTPASRLQDVSATVVLRSTGQPPTGGNTAAAGTADFALGSAEVVARTGLPRSIGMGRSSATAEASVRRVARAAGPVAPTAASGLAQASPALPGAVASGPSELLPSLNIQDSAARRGGIVRPFAAHPSAGAGPASSSGTPGPVGVAQSTRVTRHESIASAVAGGGTPRPGRTVGGDVATTAVGEVSEPATTAASGGNASQAAPWRAQVSGPRREISGLPGELQGQPMAGALASLSAQGAPLPGAAARRAVASQQEEPGGTDRGSSRSATIRRDDAGADLPSAAVPLEGVAETGAGGVAVAQGGLPSSLQTGPSATVRQAAAQLPVGQTTAAAGTSDTGLGAAEAVAVAGPSLRESVGVDVPGWGASATGRPPMVGRTASIGPAIAGTVSLQTEPPAQPAAGVPAAGAGEIGQSTADALQGGVAQGSGRLTSFAPVEGTGALVPPQQGAVAMAQRAPGNPDRVGTMAGRRRTAEGAGPGPIAADEIGRRPQPTTSAPGLLSEVAEPIERARAIGPGAGAPSGAIAVAEAVGDRGHGLVGEPSRPEGGLPVRIPAEEGPGGLGYLPSPEVGIPSRRARLESETVQTIFKRFVIERSGGQLAIDGRVREAPAEAYRQREPGRRAEVAQAWGGSEGTERAVEMGLEYFARRQFPDGHWSLHKLPEGVEDQDPALGEMEADSAATGLALLSYLGAGYTHLDDKYRGVVRRGMDWLIRHQKPDGDLFTGGTKYARFYSHGIAAIALCEAYGMTRDAELREPARKAIEFIVNTQHPTRGGWRYDVHPNTGRSTETDTSVSGWMLMALKSAQMAGLEVPEEALEKVNAWLDTARAAGAAGQYVYNPHAMDTPEQRAGRQPNLAMTSEAMLMRMYLGFDRDDPGLLAGAKYLEENLPEVGTEARPLRDCYYWYYATQAMFQMQGDYWTAWNDRLRPLATSSQIQSGPQAGSWHPLRPVEDRWGRAAGRHYVTALHILILEVYYRHLPLFQELTK
jgi:hypothetical protein